MSGEELFSTGLNRGTVNFGDRSSGARSTARPKTRVENVSEKKPAGGGTGEGAATGGIPKSRKHRPQSPGLKWHKDISEIDPQCGRVLVIDFVKQDKRKADVRKVAAREIFNLEKLRKVYSEPETTGEAVLRVFHVQNAPWATLFLLRKFNIYNRDDIVGTDFGKYVKHKRPERRGGKPFLSGKTWKVRHDPWRGISATSFGLDYLKHYKVPDPVTRGGLDPNDTEKMMELNCYNENDDPVYGYDVYVQRISCYVQHKEVSLEVPNDPDIQNPYHQGENGGSNGNGKDNKDYFPKLNTLDNGSAILIFDNSHTGSIADTLIAARQTWESRWRRLPFYLALESREMMATDEQLALQCSKIIMEDIFKGIITAWDGFLDLAMDHVSILEDKIYEQPADETRAPELWANSSLWLKVEKLMFLHIDIVKEMAVRLRELTDDIDPEENWLADTPGDFDRLANLVTEDLVKPTETLISLLYQSVSIRDSRHSIQLGVSMWRLSWITFIFLPLTFMVGFFGMNVDTFSENPSIKWYFIASVPFMACILALWYIMKHVLARERQTPYQRGIYESFFHDMATNHPTLWSRVGPRDYIQPRSRMDKIKWLLIRRWSAPEKTIKPTSDHETKPEDDLGAVSKMKRYFIRRWTSQIKAREKLTDAELSLEDGEDNISEPEKPDNIVPAGIAGAMEVLSAPATESMATKRLTVPDDTRNQQLVAEWPEPEDRTPQSGVRRSRRRSRRSSSAARSSGVLVEEEDWHWLHEQGTEGRWVWRSNSRSRSRGKSPPGSPPPPPFRGRGPSADDSKSESGAENHPSGSGNSIDAMAMGGRGPTEPDSKV
ncbi:hypothetical protein FQN54_004364 [Arachnomyces sp. PD_36]|nr:hypothetical protein FQN54_004364 [Arachnomyces sp. PD_36]